MKKETVEALKTTGEFIGIKAEEGGEVIVAAGEKAGEAVKGSIDDFQDLIGSIQNETPWRMRG